MDKIIENNVVNEVESSFIRYSMSVIMARALPDLRDGLKPVHRRILYSMYESGYTPDKPHRKSARIVGDVMGKYHPHGDLSIYDAMVRMAQPFSFRHMLVDGHGNFGNLDGDGAAAMRYTEARLSKLSLEMVRDINKETVDFTPNFDETEKEPEILPSRFPNILVNGTMGIAVGMATNIPPHNLGEVIDGCVAYIDNPDIDTDGLMQYIKGPDFPTGATILGNSGIKKAYETGRGTITIRGKVKIEEVNGKSRIIVTELPYQVNKAEFQSRIGELVRDKILDGISDLHEESNLENPVRVVIYLKRDVNANVVLNNLYKHTQLQTTYGINFLMLDQKSPVILPLKDIIAKYIDYQREIIIRRTRFDLKKAEARVHILEGIKIALDHLDEVIKTIRESSTDEEAKEKLINKFGLDEIQAEAILEMRLRRLTGLEREKIEAELNDLLKKIEEYKAILASDEKVLAIIRSELLEIKDKYADERRTNIDMTAIEYIEDESLIPEENIMIALTNKGYIKRTTTDTFKSQNRGGVGVKGMTTNDEDFVEHLINLSTHDYVLFFTNKGKVYRLKGYEVPEFSRQSKGIPVINLLQIDKDESINSLITISRDNTYKYLLFATKKGIVKKTAIEEFDNIRTNGKICITLRDTDELISVRKTTGNDMILIGSSSGRMVKFNENSLRPMGRTASGVKGINLEDNVCIGAEIASDDDKILIVTEKGYGKQTYVREFRETSRGSKGVKALNITDKNGSIASFKLISDNSDVVIITNTGMLIRLPLAQVSTLGRVTQGVRLIHLKDNQNVSTISIVEHEEENPSEVIEEVKEES
ncbi:TPA: DNA gyrase subunit A [Candidatus Ventrenecus avicola]|nr:DNA gyrase subunit A [Candidatus Ventrenecus avicola]